MTASAEEARLHGRQEGELHAYRNQAMIGGRTNKPSLTAILASAGAAVGLVLTVGGLLLNIGGRIEAMNGAIAVLSADQARNTAALNSGREERRASEARQGEDIRALAAELRQLTNRQITTEVQVAPLLRLIEPRRPQSWPEMVPTPSPVQPTQHAEAE